MPAKKHRSPFVAELKPSKKLQRLHILIHVIAVAACIANALSAVLKLAMVALIGLNFKMSYHRFKTGRFTIKHTEKQGWQISDGGEFESVTLLNSTVITTTFIFLHMPDKPTLIIPNDALDEDEFKRLIVKLRMTAHSII